MEETEGRSSAAVPQFFAEWRDSWGSAAASWTLLDYVNQQAGVPFVIAAGRLFNPPIVEYRGAVFLADQFDQAIVDEWFVKVGDDVRAVSEVVNRVNLWDLFGNCDLDGFDDALAGLAADIAASWRGVLSLRFPGRSVDVTVTADGDGNSYGPSVTFWVATA